MRKSKCRSLYGLAGITWLMLVGSVTGKAVAGEPSPITLTLTVTATSVHVDAKASNPDLWINTQMLIDADGDARTGYSGAVAEHGFEVLVEGTTVYQFKGTDQTAWSWNKVGTATRKVDGKQLSIDLDVSLLGGRSSTASVLLRSLSADYQAIVAASSATAVDLHSAKSPASHPAMDFAQPHADRNLPARERFHKISSYCCYYGADKTSELSHFDAVILHTPAQTAAQVKRLSDLGVVTIGYLSVGEDEHLRAGDRSGPGGYASWYFDRNHSGKPDRNSTWNSWYANAADTQWRADRIAEAERLCGQVGFDGIFLDTIETCDSYPQSRRGMIQLVSELREALPNKVIVMNRGFSLLKEPDIASKIDGLMFETFSDTYDFDLKQYLEFAPQDMDATREVMVANVLPACRKYPLKVLALDYCQANETDRVQRAFDRAVSFGMVPSANVISLDEVFDTTEIVGKPNSKYLGKQATPESLTYIMTDPRNGFPVGTRVVPSSCFLGYSVAAVVDGIKDRQSLHWAKAAWASAEEAGVGQQLDFDFPTAISGGNLKVLFAVDSGTVETAKLLRVQTQAEGSHEWVDQHVTINNSTATCALPSAPFTHLRVIQAPGGGSEGRPDLMWIAQVERNP